jgi:hypothetical protein
MTLLINIQINLLFKRKFPIGLTSKFGNLVWPNARAALVLSVSLMFYTDFESLNSVDGLWQSQSINKVPTRFDVYIKGNRNDFFATRGADIAIVTDFGMDLLVIYY